ncbi:hypothetical protein T069G_05831 [Trichoderma breve]|uniref:RRM domain-containing protein n=1 Tax=Trichoderma breve TaxID=2034170 RepID=A0A9W9BCQ3_9HYPO|nr:hypothetical protein T069G_05831 [Trichoderma breve]KAJ4860843.1 hypothetical protein T069G_05831 [Trichoderma breve]
MPSNWISTTSLKSVEPGDMTGEYYILFSNLPFNSTWQQVKDWVSASCDVDFVEVYPVSSSGWIRLKGKGNFKNAFTYMDNEPFKDRCIIIDGRNETECVNIRVRQPGRFNRRSSLTGGNRGRRTALRQSQSPSQGPMPQHRRTDSLAQSEVDAAADTADTTRAPVRANEDVLALANFILSMSLRSTLQMQQQYGLPLGFPFYGGGYYTIGNANTFPNYDGGHEQDEAIFADDASQSSH